MSKPNELDQTFHIIIEKMIATEQPPWKPSGNCGASIRHGPMSFSI